MPAIVGSDARGVGIVSARTGHPVPSRVRAVLVGTIGRSRGGARSKQRRWIPDRQFTRVAAPQPGTRVASRLATRTLAIGLAASLVVLTQADAASYRRTVTVADAVGEGESSFGTSITGTPDGRLLVGAPVDSAGSAQLFDAVTGALVYTIPGPALSYLFGSSVAAAGDDLLVGDPSHLLGDPSTGGAFEILQGTDIRVAGESAVFGVTEVQRGLFPMAGSTGRLRRQIGYAVAAEMLICGEDLPAKRATNSG